MAATTTSSHTAPASARTMLPSTVISLLASRTTVRSVRSSAITTFEPPASTSSGCERLGVQLPQRRDHLLGGGAGDHPARDRSDAQRGQRRQRHVVGDAAPAKTEPAHGR